MAFLSRVNINLIFKLMKDLYILLTLAIFVTVPASIFAQELVLNGDLELWDDPETPTDWVKAEAISQTMDPVHSGTYSAGHTSASSSLDLQQNVQGIIGGTNYSISYYFLDNVTDAKTRIWSYWLEGDTYLTDNEAELRPQEYSSDSPDWQLFTASLTAPATADGFRFEVRVYHENNLTGGMVYYDDFSIMAVGISPEPTNHPTDFSATAAGININLSWTDAIGDQLPSGYIVLASNEDNITAPVDGTVVDDDTDLSDGTGALNVAYGTEMCSFGDLESNTPYYFKIYPYTNGGADIDYKNDGTAQWASATTADVSIIESEDFDDGWGDWTRISISGDQEWEIDDLYGFDDSPYAKCTGYDGQPYANEDWLISPPMNFNNYSSEVLSFYNADYYDGPVLEALISNDYDGSDPTTATWTSLEFETSTGYFEWINSGDVDVSDIDGNAVYIAFKFTSTSQESATWEVDEVLITGAEASGIGETNTFSSQLSIYPNPAISIVRITSSSDDNIEVSLYSITGTILKENIGFSGSCSIDISDLAGGIYLLNFTDEQGNSKIEKLIIDK